MYTIYASNMSKAYFFEVNIEVNLCVSAQMWQLLFISYQVKAITRTKRIWINNKLIPLFWMAKLSRRFSNGLRGSDEVNNLFKF